MIDFIQINKLFNIQKGSLQSTKCTEGEYDFITASSEWKTHNKYTHDQEALIVAVSASGSLGRVHYVNGQFISSDLCFILTPKSKEFPVDLSFYYYIFRSIRDDLVKSTATGTSKLAINKTNFGNYKLPYVDITKQRDYKSKLINVAERKAKLRKSNEIQLNIIQTLRQQILQDAITGKLSEEWRKENPDVESAKILLEKIKTEKEELVKEGKNKKPKSLPPILKDEITFELPTGWVWCRLGEITNIVRGGSPRPAGDPTYYNGNIPFLKVADLTKDNQKYLYEHTYTIKKAGLYKTRLVPSMTLMLTNSGATLGVPKICTFETTFNDGIAAFINLSNYLFAEYLYYFLLSKTSWFLDEASRGQGQPNLNTDIIGDTIFPLTSIEEQKFIVGRIESLFTKLDRIKELNIDNQNSINLLNQIVLKEMFEK